MASQEGQNPSRCLDMFKYPKFQVSTKGCWAPLYDAN